MCRINVPDITTILLGYRLFRSISTLQAEINAVEAEYDKCQEVLAKADPRADASKQEERLNSI